MMKGSVYLLLTLTSLSYLLVSKVGAQTQGCLFPDSADVAFVLNDALDIIAGADTNSDLHNHTISCLSVSRMVNRFRLATAVVNFTTDSDALLSIGCAANRPCISFLEMACNDANDRWERNQIFATLSFTKDGNESLSAMLRTDCGNCGIERSIPPGANPVFDPKTHCFRCNSLCLIDGFRQCFGLIDSNCCNFYEEGVCIDQCSDRRVTVSETNFTCICNNSFTGRNCNECNITCGPNGVRNTEYCICDCSPGFTGDTCDVDINECQNVNCRNNATCTDLVNDFRCNCIAGFEGRFCENDINECETVNCNNGTCMNLINNFRCDCNPGFTGRFCNITINICTEVMPCLNGASCFPQVNNYTCQCFGNFTGRNCSQCETPLILSNGRCASPCDIINPCQNGGTCTNQVDGTSRCMCPSTFTGSTCNTSLPSACTPNPCMNNATCTNSGPGRFQCTCLPNFSGDKCQNCDIKNCQTCSTIDKVCSTCINGFVPANASTGGCAKDLSQCYTQRNPPLCKWMTVTSACCYTDTCPKESTYKGMYSGFKRDFRCYEKFHNNWRRRAESFGVFSRSHDEASQLKHNTLRGLIVDWREGLEGSINSLQQWVNYLRRTMPNMVIPSPPTLETSTADVNALYNEYIEYWNTVVNIFNNKIIPLYNQ